MKNLKLKQEIKRLAGEQVRVKPLRKTSNSTQIEAYTAVQVVNQNKEKLRHLYVAYNVLRCKEVIPFTKREFHQSLVDKYVEQYKEDFAPKTEE